MTPNSKTIKTGILVSVCVFVGSGVLSDYNAFLKAAPPAPQPARTIAPIGVDIPPEQMHDPPVAPDVLMRQAVSPRMVARLGAFTSIQVNVNAFQNNIVGDAANEPSIAVNPADPDQIVIAWRQFDSIASDFRQAGISYSHNSGTTWTKFTLDPGQFRSDPVLGADAAGTFFFSSLSSVTTAEVFRSFDGGVTWAEAGAFGGDKQWMAVDARASGLGAGHIYENWNVQFSCCPPNDFTRSINGGLSFQSPSAIPTPSLKWGTMDVGADGTLYIAGSNLNNTGHLFTKSLNAKDPAVTPTFSAPLGLNLGGVTTTGGINPAGMLGPVWIVADKSSGPTAGNLYVLGSVANGSEPNPINVKFIRSTDGGATWSSPVMINDDPNSGAWHWFGTMSVAPNGRIDVIWNDTRNDVGNFLTEVFYSSSSDGGLTWSPNIPVGPSWDPGLGYPVQQKIGDYYHMVSDNAAANLAYAATYNGEEDVYFLRIVRDCNNNGIDDDCDVACGAPGSRCDVPGCGLLADCNGNALPDICEPNVDCNNNSIQDICDIANQTSQDCNDNQVPDECESTADCNDNTIPDFCDIASGTSQDCNQNSIPDECDIGTISTDANNDEIPDECQGACCTCSTCTDITPTACQTAGGAYSGLGVLCGSAGACTPGVPANNACAQAVILPGIPTTAASFSNICATLDGPANVNCPSSQPVGKDLWYKYTAPCTGNVTVSSCGSTNFDEVIDVYGGQAVCPCPTTTSGLLACNDDGCGTGGGPSVVTFNVTQGMCYTIRVSGWTGASGTGAINLTYNTACDITPPTPQRLSPDKCRFLSMSIPTAAQNTAALRVSLDSLHHVDPPYPAAPSIPFTAFEGQVRWVGPPQQFVESSANPTTFYAAQLQCTPHYRDWNTIGALHVTGSAIVPSSTFTVQSLGSTCEGMEESCANVSPSVPFRTTRWGDVQIPFNPPDATVQPDFADIAALVDKFRSAPTAITKSETLLYGADQFGVIDIAPDLDFSHISACVDAFRSVPYTQFFTIASCP